MTKKNIVKEFQSRIEEGIKYLNRAVPGWYERIDLKKLDLKDNFSCVCGQLFEAFWDLVLDSSERAGPNQKCGELRKIPFKKAESYGFVLVNGDQYNHGYDLLTRLWYLAIVELRAKKGVDLGL